MRAKITFKIRSQQGSMPHYHQNLLAAWVSSIKATDEKWQSYEAYNFSSLRGQATSLHDGLRYQHDQVRLVLSAPDVAFVDFFVEQVFGQEVWEVGMLHLEPFHVIQQAPREFSDEVQYLCISPLVPSFAVLQDAELGKQFLNPQQDLFSDWLYECTMSRMEQSGLYTAEAINAFFKFQLVPDHTYLHKLKRQGKLFARYYPMFYQGTQYEVRGYIFPFTLHAHPDVQAFVYDRGLGAFTQYGMGMIDFS